MTGSPFYSDGSITLHHGDCLDVVATLADASVNRMAMTGDDSRSASFGSAGTEPSMLTARSTPPPIDNLTDDAKQWQGWGTALKPAFEPIVVARKPLIGTVAANVLAHGTGALHIDACRIGGGDDRVGGGPRPTRVATGGFNMSDAGERPSGGRWPANVVLDESQAAALDEQVGPLHSQDPATRRSKSKAEGVTEMGTGRSVEYDDKGGPSRFFYCAKAPKSERPKVEGVAHPTVKPLELMRWLVRLVTPPGGTVLDPFAGSGTTAEACVVEGFRCIAIEREADYLPLILARLSKSIQPDIFGGLS